MSRPIDQAEDSFSSFLSPFAPPAPNGASRHKSCCSEAESPFSTELTEQLEGELAQDELERDELVSGYQGEVQGETSGALASEEFETEAGEEAEDQLERDELEDQELEDPEAWAETEDELDGELEEQAGASEDSESASFEVPTLDSFAAESLADEQSLAEEAGEEEAGRSSVSYPSGEVLQVVRGATITKADEYWDPHRSGNPLVDTSEAQGKKRLSANFTVAELARSGSHRFDKARIDPKLVRCLQAIRDRVGKPVRVNSGFRSWGYNQQLYRGRSQTPTLSRHCSGQAADIGIAGMSGLDVAKAAIDSCGDAIGVGIDKSYAHVDVRGSWAKWTYPGLGGAVERRRALEQIEQYRRQRKQPAPGGAPAAAAPPAKPVPAPTSRPAATVASAKPGSAPGGRDPDVGTAHRIAGSLVTAAIGADPELPGTTIGALVEHWRRQISPEIPPEVLRAFIRYESSGRFDDATHGTRENRWTSPAFYELGIFQTPAGLHGRCTSGDRRGKDCEFPPPGQEKPGSPSTWARLCQKIGANPANWRNPTTQVRVGLGDLEDGAARLRQDFPDLFPTPGSDWDIRMAVLYRFSRGGGAARSFLRGFRSQLAALPEDRRWGFLRDKKVVVKGPRGPFERHFKGENVEKKMVLAAKLGYVPKAGGTPATPLVTAPAAPAAPPAKPAATPPAQEMASFAVPSRHGFRLSGGQRRAPWYGIVVHTTGSGPAIMAIDNSKTKRGCQTAIDCALHYYRHGGGGFPHYVIDFEGGVHVTCPESHAAWHAGWTGGRAGWKGWAAPEWWSRVWGAGKTPADLVPADARSPNSRHLGIEILGSARSGTPDTDAQYRSLARLIVDLDRRHGLAIQRAPSSKLLGHEDVNPLTGKGGRANARGGWDPGAHRVEGASPRFSWERLWALIQEARGDRELEQPFTTTASELQELEPV